MGVLVTATPGNWPPAVPALQPNFGTGYVGARLGVSVVALDPEGGRVSVRVSWGDGDTSDWDIVGEEYIYRTDQLDGTRGELGGFLGVLQNGTAPTLRANRCNSSGTWGIWYTGGATPRIHPDNTAVGNKKGQIMR